MNDNSDISFCIYYMIGDRPVRISYIMENVPVMAEIPDPDSKTFTIDNSFIHIAAKSTDIVRIDQEGFETWCEQNGYKKP